MELQVSMEKPKSHKSQPEEFDLVRLLRDLGPSWATAGTPAVVIDVGWKYYVLEIAIPDKDSITGYDYKIIDASRDDFFHEPHPTNIS